MDFSQLLFSKKDEDGIPIEREEGDDTGSGKGIFSIRVESHNGRFVKCFTVEVDRSPSGVYPTPEGYKMVSTATTLSTGGVHIVEKYVPQVMLDIDKLILLLDSTINPTEGSASGIVSSAITNTQREKLYQGLGDVSETFKRLLEYADVSFAFTSNLTTTKCLKELSFGFKNVGMQEIDGLLSKRITPATFMQIVYAGFEIILVQQSPTSWELTDMYTLIKDSNASPVPVTLNQLASISSSYDYKKMAKYSNIGIREDGSVGYTKLAGDDSVGDLISQKGYQDVMANRLLSSHSLSVATGSDVEISAPSLPLLRVSTLRGVVVTPGTDDEPAISKWTPEGDCLGGKEIEAVAVKIKPVYSGFQSKKIEDPDDVRYDVSALGVKVKGLFSTFLHSMMAFRNKLESENMSMTLEGVSIGAFTSFKTPAGGSLQKVVITPSSAEKVVESANSEMTGFIMNSTTIRAAGRIISVISYVNANETFPLVFGTNKK